MHFRQLKTISLLLVLWLALLQGIAPLLHAHLRGAAESVDFGIHVHADETGLSDGDTQPSLKTQHIMVQVIGVAIGVVPDNNALPVLVPALLFMLAILAPIAASAALQLSRSYYPWRSHILIYSAPRAPPRSERNGLLP